MRSKGSVIKCWFADVSQQGQMNIIPPESADQRTLRIQPVPVVPRPAVNLLRMPRTENDPGLSSVQNYSAPAPSEQLQPDANTFIPQVIVINRSLKAVVGFIVNDEEILIKSHFVKLHFHIYIFIVSCELGLSSWEILSLDSCGSVAMIVAIFNTAYRPAAVGHSTYYLVM